MYFAQGVPWGFMGTALVTYLTAQGVKGGAAGDLSAMMLWPWTFNLIWAPFIDVFTVRSMGRRRPWIIGAELLMAMSLLTILMMGDVASDIKLLGWMFFLHNCFASMQDVATDALAVDVLPRSEQGKVNGMMWGTKLFGKATGAVLMAYVIRDYGITAAVWCQFGILMLIMLFPLMMLERPGERRFPWSSGEANMEGAGATDENMRRFLEVMGDLFKGFAPLANWTYFVFGICAVVGWGIVEVLTKPLWTQELGLPQETYSLQAGKAVWLELGGAIFGGYIADKFGRRLVMSIGFGGYGLMAIGIALLAAHWNESMIMWYLILCPGVLAFGAVGFNSMGMEISWTKSSATMFTIYMTSSNVGHAIGNKLVGPLQERLGLSYSNIFMVAGLSLIIPLALLIFVNPKQVAANRAKDEETPPKTKCPECGEATQPEQFVCKMCGAELV